MKLMKLQYQIKKTLVEYKGISAIMVVLLMSNFLTYQFSNKHSTTTVAGISTAKKAPQTPKLYLLNEAEPYVFDLKSFEQKVRKVSDELAIPPEWLMAVMHSESRFDASVSNHKGSGATGLIQWMPGTAKDFNVTTNKLRNMNHVQQLDFAYKYLDQKRKKHEVSYESLTDLYLAILYPKALGEEYCYTMYSKPSKAYEMNVGLDEDKDGRVTVQDIDKRMKRVYLPAYVADLQVSKEKPLFHRLFSSFTD